MTWLSELEDFIIKKKKKKERRQGKGRDLVVMEQRELAKKLKTQQRLTNS
jgi:hypothetical protein